MGFENVFVDDFVAVGDDVACYDLIGVDCFGCCKLDLNEKMIGPKDWASCGQNGCDRQCL